MKVGKIILFINTFALAKEKNNLFTLSLDWVLRLFLYKRYALQNNIYLKLMCAYLFFLFKLVLNKKATILHYEIL